MTVDNDKLIEEAASAIYAEDAAWGYVADYGQGEVGARWEDLGPRLREGFRERARAALAVFEKALGEATVTPTDDEREAWRDEAIRRYPHADVAKYMRQALQNAFIEGAKFAAGFRRTEGPEPRAAQVIAAVRAYADDRFRYGRQNRTVGSMRIAADLYAILGLPTKDLPTEDPQGEPSDALASERAETVEWLVLLGVERRAAEMSVDALICAALRAQGEPSDAQDIIVQEVSRLAGMQLLRRYSSFSDTWWDELHAGIARVALTASAVTDQGENHG